MIIGVSLSLPKATGAKGSENATPHMKIIIDVSRREATGAAGAERATPLRLKLCPRYVGPKNRVPGSLKSPKLRFGYFGTFHPKRVFIIEETRSTGK